MSKAGWQAIHSCVVNFVNMYSTTLHDHDTTVAHCRYIINLPREQN